MKYSHNLIRNGSPGFTGKIKGFYFRSKPNVMMMTAV